MNVCLICANKTNNIKFCSLKCYGEYRKEKYSGENHPKFGTHCSNETKMKMREVKLARRKPVKKYKCLICGKETKNSKYCNGKCFGQSRPFHGKHHTEKSKKQMSEKKTMLWKDSIFVQKQIDSHKDQPLSDTSIEIAIQNYLKSIDIEFETQKAIAGIPDIYIPKYNICIFADGEWYHADPRKYKANQIINFPKRNPIKVQKIWDHDKKVTDYLESQGYIVLRFWEHDINKNFDWVKEKLLFALHDAK